MRMRMRMRMRLLVVGPAAVAAVVSVSSLATAPTASADCLNNPMLPPGIGGNCPADIDALPGGGASSDYFNQQAIDAQNGVGAVGQVPKMVVVPGA